MRAFRLAVVFGVVFSVCGIGCSREKAASEAVSEAPSGTEGSQSQEGKVATANSKSARAASQRSPGALTKQKAASDDVIQQVVKPWPFGSGSADDADRDGVADAADRCPDTRTGARVDAAGCPIDGDGDGVPDGIDRCDGTAKGTRVDERGCPVDARRR